eukprot:14942-Heterococcus_DN1.PRE.2
MEDIIENDSKISHEALSNILEEHADEPSKHTAHRGRVQYVSTIKVAVICDRQLALCAWYFVDQLRTGVPDSPSIHGVQYEVIACSDLRTANAYALHA